MANTKTINIVNGTGTANVPNDTYNVTANVNGYNNTSINPNSVTITNSTTTQAFTISATGTLTLHVTENGTESGTPIVGATFVRTNSTGTEYGTPITTNEQGNAIFNYVPFSSTENVLIYFKQTASDGSHNYDTSVQSVSLTTSTLTKEITNSQANNVTFTLTDTNYTNLPVDSGTITLTKSTS